MSCTVLQLASFDIHILRRCDLYLLNISECDQKSNVLKTEAPLTTSVLSSVEAEEIPQTTAGTTVDDDKDKELDEMDLYRFESVVPVQCGVSTRISTEEDEHAVDVSVCALQCIDLGVCTLFCYQDIEKYCELHKSCSTTQYAAVGIEDAQQRPSMNGTICYEMTVNSIL